MTSPRGSLPGDAIPTRGECLTAAGEAFAAARHARDELYTREGAMGVARAAHVPGGPSIKQLAEGYEALAQEARQRREAAAA